MSHPTSLAKGWWSFDLPGYRNHLKSATYSLFPYESLPPIEVPPGEQFEWLKSTPPQRNTLADGEYATGEKPDLQRLAALMGQPGIALPASWITFMRSPSLHRRVRTCTNNYLELPDHLIKTTGRYEGILVQFMADSQVCFRWYLYVGQDSRQFVIASENPYGFDYENGEAIQIDLEREPVWYCAPTFSEFMYRFWLENEIWFALKVDRRPLTAREQGYVDHYLKPPV